MFPWRQGKKPIRREDLHCLLYSRLGCHLCDEVWDELIRWQQEYGFQLQKVDIDEDPALAAEHGHWVPVVVFEGKVRFRGRVNLVLLKRMLEAGG